MTPFFDLSDRCVVAGYLLSGSIGVAVYRWSIPVGYELFGSRWEARARRGAAQRKCWVDPQMYLNPHDATSMAPRGTRTSGVQSLQDNAKVRQILNSKGAPRQDEVQCLLGLALDDERVRARVRDRWRRGDVCPFPHLSALFLHKT